MKSVLCEMKSVLCEMKICNFMKTANRKTLDALGVSKTYSPKKEIIFFHRVFAPNRFETSCLPVYLVDRQPAKASAGRVA